MEKRNAILLKICGLKDPENIREISGINPDFMGFVFYPKSPRYVVGHLDGAVLETIPSQIKKVGVFVNEDIEKVFDLAEAYHLDMLQLHGSESPEYCRKCMEKYPVIKAFAMSNDFDSELVERYKGSVDYVLFDTKTEKFGGSGLKFDWSILKKIRLETPYFLSGGIGVEDIDGVLMADLPPGFILDINSKIETRPGLKDLEKAKTIKERINKKLLNRDT